MIQPHISVRLTRGGKAGLLLSKATVTAIFFVTSPLIVIAQNVGINSTGSPPNASAMLDISATDKGILFPRVTLCQRITPSCAGGLLNGAGNLAAAAQGLTVYQTDAGGDGEGFYYNTSSTVTPAWLKLFGGNSSSGWALTGNSGTTVGTNFIGTTDAEDFAINTNGTEKVRVDVNGQVGIGTTTPGEQLAIGANNFVFHNGGDKAIGFNTDWTSANQWTMIGGSTYQGRIHFNPTTGDLGLISSTVATGLNNLVDNRIFIKGSTANVGIGTVTPGARLAVIDNTNTTATHVLDITRQGTGASGLGVFFTHGTANNDYNAITGIGDIGMFFDIDGAPATSTGTAGIVIAPWANGGTNGTGIKIQEDGAVGIGTGAPKRQLDVWGDGTTNGGIAAANAAGNVRLNLFVDGSNNPTIWGGGTGANPIILNTTGKVGIGTTSPSYKLHVSGNIYANGGWVRVSGTKGLYFESYGGGWYMLDGTWIRNYNLKPLYINSPTRTWFNTAGIKITDGTQGANKVLTSDASGNASWQTPSGSAWTVVNLASAAAFDINCDYKFTIGGVTYRANVVLTSKIQLIYNSMNGATTMIYYSINSGTKTVANFHQDNWSNNAIYANQTVTQILVRCP